MIKYCVTYPKTNKATKVDLYVGSAWEVFKAEYEHNHPETELVDITFSDFPIGHNWDELGRDSYEVTGDVSLDENKALAMKQVITHANAMSSSTFIEYNGKHFDNKEKVLKGLTNVITLEDSPHFTGQLLPFLMLSDDLQIEVFNTIEEVDKMITAVISKDVAWNNSTVKEVAKLLDITTIKQLVLYIDKRVY